jgi:hypothetical protein
LVKRVKAHDKVEWFDRANSGKVKVKGGWMQLHEIGTTDYLGFTTRGKFIGIEFKRPSTKDDLSEEQREFSERLIKSNCVHGVAWDEESLNVILDNIE